MERRGKKVLKDSAILSVGHVRTTGFPYMFRDYSIPRCKMFTSIDHPLHPVKNSRSLLAIYADKKLKKQSSVSRLFGPYALNFFKDFFLTIFWGLKTGTVYDIAVGANNLNTFSLLILRSLGRVRKVIFHTVDYTPIRYDNPILNRIYHWLDRICCYNADIIWNSSGRMNEARIKNGVDAKKIAHTIVIPDGSNFDYKKLLPISKIDRKKIVFLGHMKPVMGVDLILDAMRGIIKNVPDVRLLLIGSGPKLEEYRKLVKTLGLEKYVNFTGFIESNKNVDDLLRTGAIGLAPFAPDENSYEFYSDVGKPKAYLAAGMPVVITNIPEIAEIIKNERAGIAISYSKEELVQAITYLLKNDKEYKKYRTNAIKLSKKYMWKNIFSEAFGKTFLHFDMYQK